MRHTNITKLQKDIEMRSIITGEKCYLFTTLNNFKLLLIPKSVKAEEYEMNLKATFCITSFMNVLLAVFIRCYLLWHRQYQSILKVHFYSQGLH